MKLIEHNNRFYHATQIHSTTSDFEFKPNILLTSEFPPVANAFTRLLSEKTKPINEVKIGLVVTAAKVALEPKPAYGEKISQERWLTISWINESKETLKALGVKDENIKIVDIEGKTNKQLGEELGFPDILFVAGGNPFALGREQGFKAYAEEFINQNGLYVGQSAGSVFLGSLNAIENLSQRAELSIDPADKEEEITGMNMLLEVYVPAANEIITATVFVPHWKDSYAQKDSNDDSDYQAYFDLREECEARGLTFLPVRDDQVVIGTVTEESGQWLIRGILVSGSEINNFDDILNRWDNIRRSPRALTLN